MPRFAHIAGSFVVVFATYWAYVLLAVPLIEPSARGASSTKPIADPGAKVAVERVAGPVSPDAWEVKDPKVLENEQIRLLMQDYQNLGDGRVRLYPCTIIFTPPGPDDRADRIARAIVLEAPAGAMLRFDQALDLSRLRIGRFLGGELHGRVTMRSRGKAADHRDELWVETRNVQLSEYNVAAAETVEFRYGPHSGRGRQMHMHFLPREGPRGNHPGANIGGLEYFECNQSSGCTSTSAARKRPRPPPQTPPRRRRRRWRACRWKSIAAAPSASTSSTAPLPTTLLRPSSTIRSMSTGFGPPGRATG